MFHVALVLLGAVAAPLIGTVARAVARTTIKGGIVVGQKISEVATDAREGITELSRDVSGQAEYKAQSKSKAN